LVSISIDFTLLRGVVQHLRLQSDKLRNLGNMSFLKPPQTDFKDHYDITRFNLVWNLTITVSALLLVVSVVNLQNENYTTATNLIEVLVGIAALIVLRATKKFKPVCLFITLSSFILVSISYFTITNALHYTTPMWGTVNVLFAFFMLGRLWGLLLLAGHILVLVAYYYFRLQTNLDSLEPFDSAAILNFVIETCIVGVAMGYLLAEFIKANKHAESNVKKSNSELVTRNELITHQNAEKEVMLKEIHHRVKNNLQVITSLLRLQAQDLTGHQYDSFTEAINRIKSMALIHEKMYQSDRLANFNLKDYLVSLTNDLIETYAVKKDIDLEINSEIDQINSTSIVPVSLIFNELISNSIKHGFAERDKGKIVVFVGACTSKENICMYYSDNGIWKEQTERSFGLELIETMTEQLEGELTVDKNEDGTHYKFTLKALEIEV
jgi:two-component sensor histidine kinase